MPLGTMVGLGPGNILLHAVALCYMGTQLPLPKWAQPQFSADVYCGQTVAYLSY